MQLMYSAKIKTQSSGSTAAAADDDLLLCSLPGTGSYFPTFAGPPS
jgi:hypothetical protein